MSVVARAQHFPASIVQAEELWYDLRRWRSWVDGFADVVERDGRWPDAGGSLTWDSTPHGRGRVTERVREHQPGRGQAVSVEDDRLVGTQRVSFVADGEGTEVTLELDYALKDTFLGSAVVDLLFIRRAVGDSLSRTLEGFGRELGDDARSDLGADADLR